MKSIAVLCFCLFLISLYLLLPDTSMEGMESMNDSGISSENEGNFTEYGDTTVVEIKTEGVDLSYSVTEIRAKAGDILLIRYTNDSEMSHNIVLVKEEADIRPVGIAALQAIASDWIPKNELNRIIAYSKLAYSGEKVEFSFKVPPPGTYPYICTYSAHWTQMQGRLISTK